MKHIMRTAFAAAAATALVGIGAGSAVADVTVNAQTALPTQHTLSKSFIKNFVDVVNKEGKGTVQVNLLGGPEITPANRAGQAIQRGVIDMLFIPAAYLSGVVPPAQAMMLQDVGIDKLHSDGAFAYYAGVFQKRLHAHLLAWSETGPASGYYLYMKTKPPMKDGVIDLKGLAMRSTGAYRPIEQALHASTVQIASGDVPTGLDRGVIQGFGWPTVGLASIGLAPKVKYRIEPKFYSLADVVLVSDKKWNSLPKDAQAMLTKIAGEYEHSSINEITAQNKADIAAADKAGVEPITMTGAGAKAYLKIASDAMWTEVGKRVDAATVKKLRGMLQNAGE